MQNLGDAIFIPAGCPCQVRYLKVSLLRNLYLLYSIIVLCVIKKNLLVENFKV